MGKFRQHKVALCGEPVSGRPTTAVCPQVNMNKFPCRKGAPPGSPVKPTQLGKQPVRAKLLKASNVWEATKVTSKNNPLAFMTPLSLKFGGKTLQ